MSTAIDEVRKEIEDGIDAIRDELARLSAAKTALVGRRPPTAPPKRRVPRDQKAEVRRALRRFVKERGPIEAGTSTFFPGLTGPKVVVTTPTSGKAARGVRQAQALALIASRPGISTQEINKEFGGGGTHAYGVARSLRQSGEIVGDHKGWRIAPKKDFVTERTLETLDKGLRESTP